MEWTTLGEEKSAIHQDKYVGKVFQKYPGISLSVNQFKSLISKIKLEQHLEIEADKVFSYTQ